MDRTSSSRYVLIIAALLIALLSGYLVAHTIEYGGPVYSGVELTMIGAGIGLMAVGLCAVGALWEHRPHDSTLSKVETVTGDATTGSGPDNPADSEA